MATIKDVARLAGVAPSTVSHYYSGNAPVSRETRARIEQAVKELGYRPNLAARSLRLNHTQTLGLIVPNIANPFFAEIVQAIGHASQRTGYSLLLADSSDDPSREIDLLQSMFRQHIDGILFIPTGRRSDYAILENAPIPIVFVDREAAAFSSVSTDNYAGGQLAARHLVGLGHRRMGLLIGDPHVKNIQQRVEGFKQVLKEHDISVPPHHIITGAQNFETGRDIQLMMVAADRPTAVFATNDIIALGAWHKLQDMNLRVPADLSLVGFDNIDMSQWVVPPLTTVEQDKRELGRQSVVTLMKAVQSKDASASLTHLPPKLIVRGSTAPPSHPIS